jgi:hypothetical protein
LQYLNFFSPHLLSINRIKVSKNFAFNFALRHYLTSFGYDLGGDLFLQIKDKNLLFTWHGYHNKDHFFPGLEAQLLDLPFKFADKTLPFTLHTMLWLQPQNQEFYTDKSQAGGMLSAQLRSLWAKLGNLIGKQKARPRDGWPAIPIYCLISQ